jgi:hypothetical protein
VVVAFYRDVGFPKLASFKDHDGFDGVILEVPGTGTQLELTTGKSHAPSTAHPESLLVLYLDSQEEVDALAKRFALPPVVPGNPYWQKNATVYAGSDPDGFQLLLSKAEESSRTAARIRGITAIAIVLLVLAYTAAVIAGAIVPNRRLSATHIALLVIAGLAVGLLIRPDILSQIRLLRIGTSGLEIERIQQQQGELKQDQAQLDSMLKEIRNVLVPNNLATHLQVLAKRERDPNASDGKGYYVGQALLAELRQLRNQRLIEILTPDQSVRKLQEELEGKRIDLASVARLTNTGREWAARLDS